MDTKVEVHHSIYSTPTDLVVGEELNIRDLLYYGDNTLGRHEGSFFATVDGKLVFLFKVFEDDAHKQHSYFFNVFSVDLPNLGKIKWDLSSLYVGLKQKVVRTKDEYNDSTHQIYIDQKEYNVSEERMKNILYGVAKNKTFASLSEVTHLIRCTDLSITDISYVSDQNRTTNYFNIVGNTAERTDAPEYFTAELDSISYNKALKIVLDKSVENELENLKRSLEDSDEIEEVVTDPDHFVDEIMNEQIVTATEQLRKHIDHENQTPSTVSGFKKELEKKVEKTTNSRKRKIIIRETVDAFENITSTKAFEKLNHPVESDVDWDSNGLSTDDTNDKPINALMDNIGFNSVPYLDKTYLKGIILGSFFGFITSLGLVGSIWEFQKLVGVALGVRGKMQVDSPLLNASILFLVLVSGIVISEVVSSRLDGTCTTAGQYVLRHVPNIDTDNLQTRNKGIGLVVYLSALFVGVPTYWAYGNLGMNTALGNILPNQHMLGEVETIMKLTTIFMYTIIIILLIKYHHLLPEPQTSRK